MIFDQIMNLGILGDLAAEVHIDGMNKNMILDIGRVNCTHDGSRSICMEKQIQFCPFCVKLLD